ncbi:Hypothetical predicted protein [Mytilus galloprovincialis]|uniref:Uncharacterized protein n=1 Tax=Mytilus galloprovincialis TaxID=29158 RepID=A0A8B6BTZ2_MYTGA|nr:Hypothetical predicted protein [Mytilus galloprovincialis]
MEKYNLEKIENLQGNDNTGHQTIALQQSSSPPQYEVLQSTNNQYACTNIAMTNSNEIINNVQFEDERKQIAPLENETRNKNETKVNQYDVIDPTVITSSCRSTEDKSVETENHTVLDQKETELDRSKIPDETQSYDVTRTINAVGPHACTGFHSRVDETVVTKSEDGSKHIVPLEDESKEKFETKGNQYEEIDHIANISVWHSTEDKPSVINNYTVLDPTETGFDRSKIINNKQSYDLAKPVLAENDEYCMSKEGTYDCAGRSNDKDMENIYNHAIDNVYDSGSHERKDFGNENAYDHFVRQKDGR